LAQPSASRAKKGGSRLAISKVEKSKKSGLIPMPLIVQLVANSRDASNGAAMTQGEKRSHLARGAEKGRPGTKDFRNASRNGRDETGFISEDILAAILKAPQF